MDSNRKLWNERQQALRHSLSRPDEHAQAIGLFLDQHARLHAAGMSDCGLWSFEDQVLERLSERHTRQIPPAGEHSIAWVVWHMTRIEDVTMNMLAGGSPQVLLAEGWQGLLKVEPRHTGNLMPGAGVAELSACIDLPGLRAYRLSVGRRPRAIVNLLGPQDLRRKVDPNRLQQTLQAGAVAPEARDLLDYWGGLTLAGLLLMPPTRHNFIHWNEAMKIKQKLSRETNENS